MLGPVFLLHTNMALRLESRAASERLVTCPGYGTRGSHEVDKTDMNRLAKTPRCWKCHWRYVYREIFKIGEEPRY